MLVKTSCITVFTPDIQAVVGKFKIPKEALDSFIELGNVAIIDEENCEN